nr:sugar transferase [Synechococcus sp. MU1642]
MRSLLFRALLLDWFGQALILSLFLFIPSLTAGAQGVSSSDEQWSWFAFVLVLYPILGWLFGSYTVLRWKRLVLPVLIQRLLITAFATFIVLSTARWFINPVDAVWIVDNQIQFLWIGGTTLWALIVRVGLRRGFLLPVQPRILLLAQTEELKNLLAAWARVQHRQHLLPVAGSSFVQHLQNTEEPLLVAFSQSALQDPALPPLIASLEMHDPRQVRVLSVLSLFEQQQERLPPFLMPETVLAYDDLPWAATFSVQAQLKRMADLLVSGVLLLLTTPFVLLSALLIWLEDRGPVFYAQQRSGWLGRPFTVYKLRTMSVQPVDAPARWTQPGDQRITAVGGLLRRVRVDELPQLLNVINGEMSLIGPRPERPELEEELERRIPHYRKRHWMRPGLSGWAQVCAPYASSIEDAELKLSYDLYYLRNFSSWLDLLILFRTVKTVLKAGGR